MNYVINMIATCKIFRQIEYVKEIDMYLYITKDGNLLWKKNYGRSLFGQ